MVPEVNVADLPIDWDDVRGSRVAEKAERELARELAPVHRLNESVVVAVAVRHNRKDVAFWLPNESKWAVVHFTGRVETLPDWPWTYLHDSWDDLVAWMPAPRTLI